MTSNLSKWIRTGAKEKGDLEEDIYKMLSKFYKERKDLLYQTSDGVVACRRKDEEKILHKHNLIILPQLYQTEVLFRSHDQMGHQGIDKVQQRILHRFGWPGLRKACERWVNACLACLQVKDPRKMKFPLNSIESSEFKEVVQIDHQKICMKESEYNQIRVIIDHSTKLAEAVPCQTASAEETCDHLITHWISRYGCPMTFQSDNGKAFVVDLTKELMKRSHIAQAHSTTYHPQTTILRRRTHIDTPFASWVSSNLPPKPGYYARHDSHQISDSRTVGSRQVLHGSPVLPRTILLLNSSTLIYIQDDALDSLLQCFTSPRTLIACLDGIIRYHLHELSQETGGKFSPCKAQPCIFSSNMLRQHSIHVQTFVAQF